MARIFISNSRLKREQHYRLTKEISSRLTKRGHEILEDDFVFSNDIDIYIKKVLNKAEVFIFLITEDVIESNIFFNEIIQISNYTKHIENKLLIPILTKNVSVDQLPKSILQINGFRLEDESSSSFDNIVYKIDEAIYSFLGKKIATDEKAQVLKEKIEHSAPKYILETIKELTDRESYLKNVAFIWYLVGFLGLIGGVGAAIWFSNMGLNAFAGKENWSITVFYAIKSIFIILLLIAASKYSFNLGKSYMGESLKISDRIHAISFGKFYLQVFDQQTDQNELKEIFRDWNINNQTNTFVNQSTNDFDPKLIEKVIELIDKVRLKDSK